MAIKALVDNMERQTVSRAGHTFRGKTKNTPFVGTAYDFAQVRGSIYLNVHDVEEVDLDARNVRILPDLTEDVESVGTKVASNNGMSSGGGGGTDSPQGTRGGTTVDASSTARAYAEQNDISLDEVARAGGGSGLNGRIVLEDVKTFGELSSEEDSGDESDEDEAEDEATAEADEDNGSPEQEQEPAETGVNDNG